jgi:hypothetical protein
MRPELEAEAGELARLAAIAKFASGAPVALRSGKL